EPGLEPGVRLVGDIDDDQRQQRRRPDELHEIDNHCFSLHRAFSGRRTGRPPAMPSPASPVPTTGNRGAAAGSYLRWPATVRNSDEIPHPEFTSFLLAADD